MAFHDYGREVDVILCPMCRRQELVGTLFCSECGAELFHQDISPPKTVLYSNEGRPSAGAAPRPESAAHPTDPTQTSSFVILRIMGTGQMIPLEGGEEFTLGRISGSQPILPDIDLTAYQAYEGGVSRLHATIRIDQGQVTITDLGSANGTRINGKKIAAHQSFTLKNEDIISLGKFKTQILINRN